MEPILTSRSSRLNLNYRGVQRGELSSRRAQDLPNLILINFSYIIILQFELNEYL